MDTSNVDIVIIVVVLQHMCGLWWYCRCYGYD